jgi:hypothetical protein
VVYDFSRFFNSCLEIEPIEQVLACLDTFAIQVPKFHLQIFWKTICTLTVCLFFLITFSEWFLIECHNSNEYQSVLDLIPEDFSLYHVYYISSFNEMPKIVTNTSIITQ